MLCARRKQKVREGGNSAVARSLLTAIKRRPHVRQMSYKQKQQEPPCLRAVDRKPKGESLRPGRRGLLMDPQHLRH